MGTYISGENIISVIPGTSAFWSIIFSNPLPLCQFQPAYLRTSQTLSALTGDIKPSKNGASNRCFMGLRIWLIIYGIFISANSSLYFENQVIEMDPYLFIFR